MSVSEDHTARLNLPLLWAGQAQKELFHNEALTLLDMHVQPIVLEIGAAAPPAERAEGDMWVAGADASGEWEGHAGMIAGWTGGGWRFIAPRPGMCIWSRQHDCMAFYRNGGWRVGDLRGTGVTIDGIQVVGARQGAIAEPDRGDTIDSEARAAISAILSALRGHGLIDGN